MFVIVYSMTSNMEKINDGAISPRRVGDVLLGWKKNFPGFFSMIKYIKIKTNHENVLGVRQGVLL